MSESDKINLRYLIAVLSGKVVIYGSAMLWAINEGLIVWK
jgi:hypothetical protein